MAIYRGLGGAGDSTTDATVTEVTNLANSASASATSAASSATSAASSASSASTSATSAATSATNAATSETNAATSETNAATSASSASSSATSATASASAASTSATAAASSASAASTSATNAATSETNAATSETNAATSETNAASSASSASTSASNAATSATAAQTAQTAAEAAQTAAEAAQEAIDGLYLGAQTSDPTLDNNGDPVTAGDWYYNTSTGVTRIYDGSAWQNGAVSTTGFLLVANDLSDLNDAATARTNLGLGTAATTASTDYATAAQGALADSALQSYTVTEGDVTAHQAALSITEGQISNLGSDIVLDSDIGVTVQGYDADTVKYDDVNPSFTDTGAIKVPTGNTAQQPGTPVAGQFRFNSETGQFEGYNGTAWGAIAGGSGGGAGLQDMFLLMGA